MKNWKTTLSSVIVSFTMMVTFKPSYFGGVDTPLYDFCTWFNSIGMVIWGINCKDSFKDINKKEDNE